MKKSLWSVLFFLTLFSLQQFEHIWAFSEPGKTAPVDTQMLIQTMTLENFEKPGSWVVKFSRFRMHNWKDPLSKDYESSDKWLTWKKIEPQDYVYFGKPTQREDVKNGNTTIMGARAKYYTKGYNWISIEPRQDLYLMGKISNLRVWVWGGNYNYKIYAILKDFKDKLYQIDLGSLTYVGWRQLTADLVSQGLRQVDTWVPQNKPVQFVRFLIVSDVNERTDRFGIWFDDLQYDTNLFDKNYYGKGLEKELDW